MKYEPQDIFHLAADFPLSDGDLFHQMIVELQVNRYTLPVFTNYNFDVIPFQKIQ